MFNFCYNISMEVFSIRLKSVRNSNVFLVESEIGGNLFHADSIVKYGIVGGCNADEKFFQALKESGELIALEMINKYLASSIKTEKQIRDYLYKKEFEKDTIDAVVAKLKEYGVIDDLVYAQTYMNSNCNFSKNKIRQKLYLSGVSGEVVDKVLNNMEDYDSCMLNAKKFLKNKELDKLIAEKLVRRLLGQGYNYETIKKVLNELKCECFDE